MTERAMCTVYCCDTLLSFFIRAGKLVEYCNGCERRKRGLCTAPTCLNQLSEHHSARYCNDCQNQREKARKRRNDKVRNQQLKAIRHARGLKREPNPHRCVLTRLVRRLKMAEHRKTERGKLQQQQSNRRLLEQKKKDERWYQAKSANGKVVKKKSA